MSEAMLHRLSLTNALRDAEAREWAEARRPVVLHGPEAESWRQDWDGHALRARVVEAHRVASTLVRDLAHQFPADEVPQAVDVLAEAAADALAEALAVVDQVHALAPQYQGRHRATGLDAAHLHQYREDAEAIHGTSYYGLHGGPVDLTRGPE